MRRQRVFDSVVCGLWSNRSFDADTHWQPTASRALEHMSLGTCRCVPVNSNVERQLSVNAQRQLRVGSCPSTPSLPITPTANDQSDSCAVSSPRRSG